VKNFVCLLGCVLVALSVWGQTTNGNIQGTVVDPGNATVAGATVTARNMDTGLNQLGCDYERRIVRVA